MIIAQRPFLKRDFAKLPYAVIDTSENSPNYFVITHFPTSIGGGKSLIKLQGNGANLVRNSEVEIEVLDVAGNPLRVETTTFVDRFNNYYATIYVYDNTLPGRATVSVVGKAQYDLQGTPLRSDSTNDLGYNVIWTKQLDVQPFERNNSELVFQDPPYISVAQVVAPLRISSLQTTDTQYAIVTASDLSITTTPIKGFDKRDANSTAITDLRLSKIRINPNVDPITTNTVDTTTRKASTDIIGGYLLQETSRYSTVLKTTTTQLSSSYVGGFIEFFTSSYTLSPQTQSGATVTRTNPYNELDDPSGQSIDTQLGYWTSTVVKVIDKNTALLETPVRINIQRPDPRGVAQTMHTYRSVTNFTASLNYTPNSVTYVTSSAVSQSYLQFTFSELEPIAGDVYKIRAFYKRRAANQDWTLLNDQIIYAPEYLTDAQYPNQTSYARYESDHLMIGHFTTGSVLSDYWVSYRELRTGYDTVATTHNTTPLMDSVRLQTDVARTYNALLTTEFYQNYAANQLFTLGFNCVLGPYTELEMYMISDVLSTNVVSFNYQPRAFEKSKNNEKSRFSEEYSRFGKFIGKITNNSANVRNYNKVVFDFISDAEGVGRPLFRCKPYSTTTTGSCWLSEISIKPQRLTGYTPRIVQFAAPTPNEYANYLSESVDYKFEYFDYTGNQSEYVTYVNNVPLNLTTEIPTIGCQSENNTIVPFLLNIPGYTATGSDGKVMYPGRFIPPIYFKIDASTFYLDPLYAGAPSSMNDASVRYFPHFDTNEVATGLTQTQQDLIMYWPYFGWNITRPSLQLHNHEVGNFTGSDGSTSNWGIYSALARVTSSWLAADEFILKYSNTATNTSVYKTNLFNQAYARGQNDDIDNIDYYNAGGAAIAWWNVSQSYVSQSNATTNAQRTEALKKRRLYWPTISLLSSSYFTENGGIYNVKFRLKKYGPSFIPQTGSIMLAYIFDIDKQYTTSTRGTAGWYPPDRNIVKIGHGYTSGSVTTPVLTWYDSATGFYYEEYDINLIQYGSPAQLVFEPYPDPVNNVYSGGVISDVQFCKIGTTTDPAFIKPQSISSIYSINAGSQGNTPQK
jgi:hypothetical protein